MWRKLLNLAAVLSLMLCLATAGVWVRSSYTHDRWTRGFGYVADDGSMRMTTDEAVIANGTVKISRFQRDPPPRMGNRRRPPGVLTAPLQYSQPQRGVGSFDTRRPDLRLRGWAGFQFARPVNSPPFYYADGFGIAFPVWAVTIAFAVVPTLRIPSVWRRARAARWRRTSRCAHCGYDVRATPDRCPECGAVAATAGASRSGRGQAGFDNPRRRKV
jgi:hypothetical protein